MYTHVNFAHNEVFKILKNIGCKKIEITVFIVVFLVVVKFFVFVSEVVSILSKILTWIFLKGQKDTFAPNSIIGGRAPRLPL